MMKRIITLFLLILPTLLFSANIKVITFNIRYDNPADSIFSWKERKAMVFRMLDQEKPDILCTQEVLRNQAGDILTQIKRFDWFGVGRDDGKDAGEYSAIFFDKSKFEKLDGSVFWLSEKPHVPGSRSWNSACTRIVTWVKLKEKKTGKMIFVFNTHFDHVSESARENSAAMLVRAVDSLAGKNISIITGDFNDNRKSKMFSLLTADLTEARTLHNPVFPAPDFTFIGFPYKEHPGDEIDFIFLKNPEKIRVQEYHAIRYNENGLYPSDHLPVKAIITL